MKTIKIFSLLLCTTLLISAFSIQQKSSNIDGIYDTLNAGERILYYITQKGDMVYGFGDAFSAKYSFVFKGKMKDGVVKAKWYSIPKGTVEAQGDMTIRIDDGVILEVSGTNGFPNNSLQPYRLGKHPQNKIKGFEGKGVADPTGRYQADNAMQLWLRQLPDNQVVFFGQTKPTTANDNRPGMASVFFGKRNGDSFNGEWIDLPLGFTKNSGQATYKVYDDYLYFDSGYFPGVNYKKY